MACSAFALTLRFKEFLQLEVLPLHHSMLKCSVVKETQSFLWYIAKALVLPRVLLESFYTFLA